MNSSSKPSSPNSGNLASASGYEKIGNALGGWGGGSTTQQPYGQFPSMGKQPQYQDWTDTRPPSEQIGSQPPPSGLPYFPTPAGEIPNGPVPSPNVPNPQEPPPAGFEPWIPGGGGQQPNPYGQTTEQMPQAVLQQINPQGQMMGTMPQAVLSQPIDPNIQNQLQTKLRQFPGATTTFNGGAMT